MTIEEYFRRFTEDIVFVEPLEEANISALNIQERTPLPLWADALIDGVIQGTFDHEIKSQYFFEGMVAMLGTDPDFAYATEYQVLLRKIAKEPIKAIMKLAVGYNEKKELNKAAIALRAILTIESEHLTAKANLAAVYGELFEASDDPALKHELIYHGIRLLEDVLKHHGDNEVRPLLAKFYIHQNQYQKAKLTLEPYMKLGKDAMQKELIRDLLLDIDPIAWSEIITLQLETGQLHQAETSFHEALKLYPEDKSLLYLYAIYLWSMGLKRESNQLLVGLIDRQPQPIYYNQLIIHHYLEQEIAEGVKIAAEGVKKFPEEATLLGNYALLLDEIGETHKAKETIDHAITLATVHQLDENTRIQLENFSEKINA